MKFSENRCKILHLGLNNLKQQHRVETDWLGSNSAEKELGGAGIQTEQESAACPCSKDRPLHPGLYQPGNQVTTPLQSALEITVPREGTKTLGDWKMQLISPALSRRLDQMTSTESLPCLNYHTILRCFPYKIFNMQLSFLGFLAFSSAVSHTGNCQITYGVCRPLI